jgi:hypothetical protein
LHAATVRAEWMTMTLFRYQSTITTQPQRSFHIVVSTKTAKRVLAAENVKRFVHGQINGIARATEIPISIVI